MPTNEEGSVDAPATYMEGNFISALDFATAHQSTPQQVRTFPQHHASDQLLSSQHCSGQPILQDVLSKRETDLGSSHWQQSLEESDQLTHQRPQQMGPFTSNSSPASASSYDERHVSGHSSRHDIGESSFLATTEKEEAKLNIQPFQNNEYEVNLKRLDKKLSICQQGDDFFQHSADEVGADGYERDYAGDQEVAIASEEHKEGKEQGSREKGGESYGTEEGNTSLYADPLKHRHGEPMTLSVVKKTLMNPSRVANHLMVIHNSHQPGKCEYLSSLTRLLLDNLLNN
ncbi:unnamed protein product [Protopolystoma xenopodis]|uniref:Uncharacterized protein n=1 Tax=Protopolystoma xenopodis TaxID=117903 RepID=A0A3S5AJ48_9PLAT|nr:unnamed protein product [Protopolystoma xenopodis]